MSDNPREYSSGNENSALESEDRITLGRQWRDHIATHHSLAEVNRYVRIRGKDFRAVSIHPDNPCGRLLRGGSEVASSKSIKKAIDSALQSDGISFTPGNKKEEHKIQSFIIREALTNRLRFESLFLGAANIFDEIIFITDEMRFDNGRIRADIIAVAKKRGVYFPVLIELKCQRQLTKLISQLNNAVCTIEKSPHLRDVFDRFICAVADIDRIDRSKGILRMIIWPASPSTSEAASVKIARGSGICIVKYNHDERLVYRFDLDE